MLFLGWYHLGLILLTVLAGTHWLSVESRRCWCSEIEADYNIESWVDTLEQVDS